MFAGDSAGRGLSGGRQGRENGRSSTPGRRMSALTEILAGLAPTPASYLRAARQVQAGEVPELRPLRVAVLSTVSAQLLQPFLVVEGARRGWCLELSFAPFGQLEQPVLDPTGPLYTDRPEAIVVLARLEELAPAFYEQFGLGNAETAALLDGVGRRLRALLQGLRERTTALLFLANFSLPVHPVAGVGEAMLESSSTAAVLQANVALAAGCRAVPGAFVFDYARVVAEHGLRQWHDARLFALARQPWSVPAQIATASALARTLRAAFVPPAKCLVLDADQTLWGGVVGEEGLGGIALGNDYPGNVFQGFQKYLRTLKERGVLLALVSKNEEAEVCAVLEQHADSILRPHDFAVCRINWEKKSDNLRAVAAALNLGLDALVFFDDSPFEREEVRRALPEVKVLEVPSDPLEYIATIEESGVFDQLTFSSEDHQRDELYRQQSARAEAGQAAASSEEFLAGLEMVATIGSVGPDTLPRVAQLLAKTNQFNLTARRHSAAEIASMITDGAVAFWLRLADRFGDYGLVGVAIARPDGSEWTVDTFLLSCRVIGRGAETALLAYLAAAMQARGGDEIFGEYSPTSRNGQVAEFYPRHGFTPCGENRWRKKLSDGIAPPSYIRIQSHE
jgi:FkbH-like protein